MKDSMAVGQFRHGAVVESGEELGFRDAEGGAAAAHHAGEVGHARGARADRWIRYAQGRVATALQSAPRSAGRRRS